MDLIITVCDRAAGESCPVWPGHPLTSHWSIPDPAAVQGTPLEVRDAFREALRILQRRIEYLVSFGDRKLDKLAMRNLLDEIADRVPGAPSLNRPASSLGPNRAYARRSGLSVASATELILCLGAQPKGMTAGMP